MKQIVLGYYIRKHGGLKNMVCYAIPTVAAIIHYATRKNVSSWKSSTYHLWLSLLLMGGAIFGIVDHLWNGELLLISEDIGYDLLLGAVITTVIFVFWGIMVYVDKKTNKKVVKKA